MLLTEVFRDIRLSISGIWMIVIIVLIMLGITYVPKCSSVVEIISDVPLKISIVKNGEEISRCLSSNTCIFSLNKTGIYKLKLEYLGIVIEENVYVSPNTKILIKVSKFLFISKILELTGYIVLLSSIIGYSTFTLSKKLKERKEKHREISYEEVLKRVSRVRSRIRKIRPEIIIEVSKQYEQEKLVSYIKFKSRGIEEIVIELKREEILTTQGVRVSVDKFLPKIKHRKITKEKEERKFISEVLK